MGIQINGQTDTISSTDGSLNIGGTVTVNVTGDATGLTGTPDITVGAVTASSATISGDLTVNGTTTTLDTVKHISASRSWDMSAATALFDIRFGNQGNFAAEFTWILQDTAASNYGTRIGKLYVAAYGSNATGPVSASLVSEDKVAGNSGTVPTITWSASVTGGKVRLTGTPSSDSGNATVYLWGASPLLSEITAL